MAASPPVALFLVDLLFRVNGVLAILQTGSHMTFSQGQVVFRGK